MPPLPPKDINKLKKIYIIKKEYKNTKDKMIN